MSYRTDGVGHGYACLLRRPSRTPRGPHLPDQYLELVPLESELRPAGYLRGRLAHGSRLPSAEGRVAPPGTRAALRRDTSLFLGEAERTSVGRTRGTYAWIGIPCIGCCNRGYSPVMRRMWVVIPAVAIAVLVSGWSGSNSSSAGCSNPSPSFGKPSVAVDHREVLVHFTCAGAKQAGTIFLPLRAGRHPAIRNGAGEATRCRTGRWWPHL